MVHTRHSNSSANEREAIAQRIRHRLLDSSALWPNAELVELLVELYLEGRASALPRSAED